MHLLDLSFIVELLSDSRVFQAVLKHGGGQWFSIGLAMGFTGSEVRCAHLTNHHLAASCKQL